MKAHGAMNGLFYSGVLANATPVVVNMKDAPLPATIWVKPAAGDTVLIEYSLDNGATFADWPLGGMAAEAEDILDSGVTHLRATRTIGAGTTSSFGVC
jgi:hypothetical protein